MRWWGGKLRQVRRFLLGRVTPREQQALAAWLTPAQRRLFVGMHRADQRHGLDVVATLRAAGHDDTDLLLAALFHDAGKGGRTGLWHRVGWSLGERYGSWVWSILALLPGMRAGLERMRGHEERSAAMALEAGCSLRTAALIRATGDDGRDPASGPAETRALLALRLADEAN
jgi:hypothetical protein